MASIIAGYEYDIFISYRQKDNKYDGWVTGFVNNLQKELETTFKDDVSIYFDINPHDGLLETYDVDESIRSKLKCLLFIPVISRTYCDPRSFAWEHEFKAFVEEAYTDEFGLKVKLPNGNVASRVIPVIIHDLDSDDILLCESILGNAMRGVNFIYKEPGVNKPLTADDDDKKNLNNTRYRIQVNKVANAIKEIISALEHNGQKPGKGMKNPQPVPVPRINYKLIITVVTTLILILSAFFLISKFFNKKDPLEKSIAILPFDNDSPDEQNFYIANGLMYEVLISLQSIRELRVISRNSVEKFRGRSRPTTPEIAKQLGVNYIVEGSLQKYGNTVRLRVELIKAKGKKESHLWAKSFEREIKGTDDIFSIQSEIAKTIAGELEIVLSPEQINLIEKAPPASLEAYKFYQRGREEIFKYELNYFNKNPLSIAKNYFKKALEYDSAFSQAYSGLALSYSFDNYFFSRSVSEIDSILYLANQAIKYDHRNAEAYFARVWYFYISGESDRALKESDTALELNPNYWEVYAFRGNQIHMWDHKNQDFSKSIWNLQKAISLNQGEDLPHLLILTGGLFSNFAGFPEQAVGFFRKALEINGDSVKYFGSLAALESSKGNLAQAIEYAEISYNMDTSNFLSNYALASLYMRSGQLKESLKIIDWIKRYHDDTSDLPTNFLHRIGYVYWQNGQKNEAEYWFTKSRKVLEESIKSKDYDAAIILGSYYDLAGVLAFQGERDKAYENLEIFMKRPVLPKWVLNLLKTDPMFNSLRNEKEFQNIITEAEGKFRKEHEKVKKWLEENNIL
jgi:TolB-like protein/Tfp pilus assembly protein PilF